MITLKPNINKGKFFKGVGVVMALGSLLTALFVDEEKAMKEAVAKEVKEQLKKKEES